MNAFLPPLGVGLMKISFMFQAIQKPSAHLMNLCYGVFCKFLGMFGRK